MVMAEDIITTDAVPRVRTNVNGVSEGGLAQIRSDAEMIQNLYWSYPVVNVFPNPTYETRCYPENDAVSSVPGHDSTTKPELQSTDDRLTNARHSENDLSIGYNENDDGNHMLDTTDAKVDAESICQSDMVASKSNINPTSLQNPGCTASIRSSHPCITLRAETIATSTTNNDDNGKIETTKDDIYSEIPDEVDNIDNDASLDSDMPFAVASGFSNPSSECNSTEHNDDNGVPGDGNNGIHGNRHIPSTDPNMRETLNRNPMYVRNVPQQARCQCNYGSIGLAVIITTLLGASIIFGTWLYFNNNVREVPKTMKAVDDRSNPGHHTVDTPYTNGHPGTDTPYTNGHPGTDTAYTNGHPGTDTPYTNGHPGTDTAYTNGHPGTDTPYTNGHPGTDTPYTNGHPVCPITDYVSFNGVCYKDFAERKTYCDARQLLRLRRSGETTSVAARVTLQITVTLLNVILTV
uniref:Uncharacterized protein n=1 Tax=Branchiostoma floridae TaxID=7739 RepID=C3ZRK7_BRAFL|eukprot:XP_002588796.1 hypothetical protein BRAFLDRAFT_89774 [Branchiostoma floridae]